MLNVTNIAIENRLKPLSFAVAKGEIVHLIGPNGSGKSTAIGVISGLFPAEGRVEIEGMDIANCDLTSLARLRAYMSQQDRPSFAIPVYQYLSLALTALGEVCTHQTQLAIDEVCGCLDITDKLSRSIHQLSGGEWQRVRLAATCLQIWPAINPDAKLLLLDEPAASLDIGQEAAMYRLIRCIASKGIAVIMANHDLNRSLREADQVILLQEGLCVAMGEPPGVMNTEQLESVFSTKVVQVTHQGVPSLLFID